MSEILETLASDIFKKQTECPKDTLTVVMSPCLHDALMVEIKLGSPTPPNEKARTIAGVPFYIDESLSGLYHRIVIR